MRAVRSRAPPAACSARRWASRNLFRSERDTTHRTLLAGLATAAFASFAAATPASADQGQPGSCPPPVDFCDPGCWELGNKVTGDQAPPDYGLRLAGLFGTSAGDHWTFDFEADGAGVTLCHDGAGTITIDGLAYGGLDVGSDWDPVEQSWVEIHFVYENASCENGDLLVDSAQGGAGYGTVEWLNTGEVVTLGAKANSAGEFFVFDGRTGDPARGWLMFGDDDTGDFAMTVEPSDECIPDPDCDGDGRADSLQEDCDSNGVPDACEPLPSCACPKPIERCDAGCWLMGDKVTGAVAPPDYGLRLDGLFGASSDHWTFGFELPGTEVQLCYDGAGTITIDGRAYGGLDVGGQWDAQQQGFLDIHFVYENASCVNGKLVVENAGGGVGYGTVTYEPTGETVVLVHKTNGSGQAFLFDHASGNDARGWLMYGDGDVGDFAMTELGGTHRCPPAPDCDGDGTPDSQESDCNGNGVPDDCEELADCDENGIADVCDIAAGALDVDQNGVPDVCEPGVEIYCVPDPQHPGSTGVPCPCGNAYQPGQVGGCANSTGSPALLTASGTPSIAAEDLLLEISGVPLNQPGIFVVGDLANTTGAPFRNGLLCIQPPLTRVGKIPTSPGGLASFPLPPYPPLWELTGAFPGETQFFQFWYRDSVGPCGALANFTNGLRVTWGL